MNFFKQLFAEQPQYTIEEIHEEFDTAQERLLKQANDILKNDAKNEKAKLYKELGFNSEKHLKETAETAKAIVLAGKLEYYVNAYPQQKFLTVDELKRICKKYNLIYAPVGRYKEDVPFKNLQEIKNAKELKPHDRVGSVVTSVSYELWFHMKGSEFYNLLQGRTFPVPASEGNMSSEREAINFAKNVLFPNDSRLEGFNSVVKTTYTRTDLSGRFIAAPKSHFNLKGVDFDGEFGYAHTSKFEVKDPIVFEFVQGSFVRILSKWGEVTDDEALINPINN
jgi:hypothetical protein